MKFIQFSGQDSPRLLMKMLYKEFNLRMIKYERQKPIKIVYKGAKVSDYRLDLLIDNKIILEIKAVSELNEVFE